ncbi:MAG TPA: complex I subunit 1 family protein [Methanoregula sp.]|nr:complex I subunit 1 family protein [Methanoregula sp.]
MIDPLLTIAGIFIFPGFLFLFAFALFLAYLDRKIAARMQQRIGPPFFQPFADFIKMLGKEVIDPDGVDIRLYDIIPLIAFAAVMTAFLYIPVIGYSPLAFTGDLVVVLYLLAIPAPALFLLGWLSRNIFSTVGGIRAITQLFIYEVPFFLALLTPAIMAGSWSISAIVLWQQQNLWFVFFQPIGFIVALVGLQAKLERAPFDIPEAETEIIAGPWTELTGRRLALMNLTFSISLVVGSALIAALFLGGPVLPWTLAPAWLNPVAGMVLFLIKTLAVLLLLSSIRVATGRIRIDQLRDIGWKYIAGAAIVQVGIALVINWLWVVP